MAYRKNYKRKRNFRKKRKGVIQTRGNVFNELNKCVLSYKNLFIPQTNANGLMNFRINTHNYSVWVQDESLNEYALTELLDHQSKQYDFYRPIGTKIEYIPNGDNTATTLNTVGNILNVPPLVLCYDADNQGQPPTLASVFKNDNSIFLDSRKRWTKYFPIKQVIQPGNASLMKGWCNMQSQVTNKTGVIWCLAAGGYFDYDGLPIQNYIPGYFKITTIVQFKSRQNSASVLGDGHALDGSLQPEYTGSADLTLGVLAPAGITGPQMFV